MKLFFLLWTVQAFAAFNLTWGTPAIGLDSNPPIGDTDINANITIDPMGNAVASWSRTTGGSASENIWASSYNHSMRVWNGAVKISGEGNALNSHLAVDENGDAIIVWEEGFPAQICYRTLSLDGVWTPDLSMPPNKITPSVNSQTSPQIAVDSNGNAVAIWIEFFGGKNHIFSAKKQTGMDWAPLGELSSGELSAILTPSKALSLNKNGDGIAVWQESNGLISKVRGALYVNGSWTLSKSVAGNDGLFAAAPSAAIDDAGDGIFVWNQENKILSKTIVNGALAPVSLTISDEDYTSLRPHVGVDAKGNAVVVYERYNAMHKFIVGASLEKGAPFWTQPVDISAPSPSEADAAGYPVFSMNSIGDGVVIWKEWTGTSMIIQGAGYSLGTWSFIRTLSSPTGSAGALTPSYDIAVTLNDAGNILAIWPEDFSGQGAQQIKMTAGVGLANTGPLPPVADPVTILSGIVTGKQIKHRFPAHADLINIISWTCPEEVAHYNVYRGGLNFLVATTREPRFEDHQRTPKMREMYLITAVDQNGQESGPMTIIVEPN